MAVEVYELDELGLRVYLESGQEANGPLANCIHHHAFCELHVVLKNSCTVLVENQVHTIQRGQACLIAPGVSHATQTLPEDMERLILSFESQKRPMPVGQFLMDAVRSRPMLVVDGPVLVDTAQMIPARTGQFGREQTCALLVLLLVQLANLLSPTQTIQPKDTSLDAGRVACIDDYLNRCFAQSSEEELAALLGLSRRQLDRVMHRHYGMGFQAKISQIRLDVACDLLRRTSLSVEQIAMQVGYPTASNFTVFFKRSMGQTPTQYRKSLKM